MELTINFRECWILLDSSITINSAVSQTDSGVGADWRTSREVNVPSRNSDSGAHI